VYIVKISPPLRDRVQAAHGCDQARCARTRHRSRSSGPRIPWPCVQVSVQHRSGAGVHGSCPL